MFSKSSYTTQQSSDPPGVHLATGLFKALEAPFPPYNNNCRSYPNITVYLKQESNNTLRYFCYATQGYNSLVMHT